MGVAKLFFEFVREEDSIRMDDSDFVVLGYEGLEATDYDHVLEDNINGIGSRLKKRKMLPRDIAVEWEYEGLEDKPQKRDELIGFFTPFSSGILRIVYGDVTREIQYEVRRLTITTQNVHDYLAGSLELRCLDPAMLADVVESEQISTWIGGWEWKFSLPFHMRLRGAPQITIVNDGQLPTPVEIAFHGPADNPRITSRLTGAYVQVNQNLTADDVLYINTAFGRKSVEIETGGVRRDAYNYIDLGSNLADFVLYPGDNVLEYQTDNETVPQSVSISYRKRYLGI